MIAGVIVAVEQSADQPGQIIAEVYDNGHECSEMEDRVHCQALVFVIKQVWNENKVARA